LNIFVFGSSILSSYWNGAATYYRGCYKNLARAGHSITFAEPRAFDRQEHQDADDFSYVTSLVYEPGRDLDRMLALASDADVIVKHSGIGVGDAELERRVVELADRSVVLFWDVDAPATISSVRADLSSGFGPLIPHFDAIFTYGGGPAIREAYLSLGAQFYCSIYNGLDPETHHAVAPHSNYACDVAFLGNRLPDREARVDELFLEAARLAPHRSFLLGGEGWADKQLPPNVRWIGHVPTAQHNVINCSATMVMNINRASMAGSGFSPPTRVFEVAGTGTCLLCDDWPGIEDCFEPGKELVVVRCAQDVANAIDSHDSQQRAAIGAAFRARALRDHTYATRAAQAEHAMLECLERKASAGRTTISRLQVPA
jgi:spore maturation protein CgeB